MTYEFIKNLNIGKKSWVMISLPLLASLLLGYFFIYPSGKEMRQISREIEELKSQLLLGTQEENDTQNALNLYKRYSKKIETMDKSILFRSRELEFITALENIAAQNGVEQRISLGDYEPIEEKPFYKMPVQIILKGNFVDELRYLEEVEALSYYVDIEKINVTQNKGEHSGEEINFFVFANTFWQ